MERLIILEVNEIPKQVVDWWVAREPHSAIASLVHRGSFAETVLDEDLPRDLYPSQSWASIGTGVPYEQHGVFWYGDPKPAEYPFYWQAAADAGRSVGLLGVLHTSPRSEQASGPNYRFVMPDLFGDDVTTVPQALAPIQELNLKLTRQSARVASLRLQPSDVLASTSLVRQGVRPATVRDLAVMAGRVASGSWNKERLRVGQSLLLADVFAKQIKQHDPDLSIAFLNHVAAFMHRYWAATFPDDWESGSGYGQEWERRHAEELPFAMRGLDRIVAQMAELADRTGRTLMIVSSMGMKADTTVDADQQFQAVIRQPEQFLAAAGLDRDLEVRAAMVPQLTVVARSGEQAQDVTERLERWLGDGLEEVMVATDGEDQILTATCKPSCRQREVLLGGEWRQPEAVGMSIEQVTDHRSGRHSPRGVLVSSRTESWPAEMSAFDVAPLLLDRLGVPALSHHRMVVST